MVLICIALIISDTVFLCICLPYVGILLKKKNIQLLDPLFNQIILLFGALGFLVYCSVAQSCPIICDPMDCSTPGFPLHHQLPELAQTHVHPVGDAIQPSHSLSPLFPPSPNLSQHQAFPPRSLQQMAKVLELQLQHQSFQGIFRVDFL